MIVFRVVGCEGANGESQDLLCRRTKATPQFRDYEIIQNLILSLGYHDFKSS